jgi:hypothetical protein
VTETVYNRRRLLQAADDPAVSARLRAMAKRLVWWETPGVALGDGNAFVAAVFADGDEDDVEAVAEIIGDEGVRAMLADERPLLVDPGRRVYWARRVGPPPAD